MPCRAEGAPLPARCGAARLRCALSLTARCGALFVALLSFSLTCRCFARLTFLPLKGADLTREHGCILLLARSAQQAQYPPDEFNFTIPPPPPPRAAPWAAARIEVTAFKCMIEPLSRTEARFTMIVNADPKVRNCCCCSCCGC